MNKYLILVDLDGTLLKKDSTISPVNKAALQKVIELGHEVVIVTGRAHYRSHHFYEELGLKAFMVNRNGGLIHDPSHVENDHILFIDPVTLETVIRDLSAYTVQLFLEHKNQVFVLKGEETYYRQFPLCEVKTISWNDLNEAINLMSLHVPVASEQEVRTYLDQVSSIHYEVFPIRGMNPSLLFNIYPNLADKAYSLPILSDLYKIPMERIIAFGDGSNDVKFIEQAGIGVAMGNGIDDVKKVAKWVTEYSHEEDGLGLFLNNYFHLDIK